MGQFGALNWSILIVFILGNLLLGYFLSKRISTADDFYLGDRTTPWWAIGISVVATYVSALSFLGGPSWAYDDGFSVIALHANYPLVIFVVITLFLPFFYNSAAASIAIGVVLILTAFWLAVESKGLLIGESASTQVRQDISQALEQDPRVDAINEVITLHMGPDFIIVTISVDFADGLSSSDLESAVTELNARIKSVDARIKRVFIEAERQSNHPSPHAV